MSLINHKYRLMEPIGSGCFGTIYKGLNVRTQELVAIKTESVHSSVKLLKNESIVYQHLKDCANIPNVKWFGKDEHHYYMVLPLLGRSLREVLTFKRSFSLALVLKIGIKIIDILQVLHSKGLVHRDIKPDNFLFAKDQPNQLYLIDFGFCTSFMEGDCHKPMRTTHGMIGSRNYASIMAHKRTELSRRDDLESLAYLLLCLLNGYLTWNVLEDEASILNEKMRLVAVEHSLDYSCPRVIMDLLTRARSMTFEEKPNYCFIKDTFMREIKRMYS